jgi:hypothetical protein
MKLKERADEGVAHGRECVEAMLDFEVSAHGVYEQATRGASHGG